MSPYASYPVAELRPDPHTPGGLVLLVPVPHNELDAYAMAEAAIGVLMHAELARTGSTIDLRWVDGIVTIEADAEFRQMVSDQYRLYMGLRGTTCPECKTRIGP